MKYLVLRIYISRCCALVLSSLVVMGKSMSSEAIDKFLLVNQVHFRCEFDLNVRMGVPCAVGSGLANALLQFLMSLMVEMGKFSRICGHRRIFVGLTKFFLWME